MDFPVLNIKNPHCIHQPTTWDFFSLYRLEALSTQLPFVVVSFCSVCYLAAPGLSGGLQDLQSFCRGVQNLKLWHTDS